MRHSCIHNESLQEPHTQCTYKTQVNTSQSPAHHQPTISDKGRQIKAAFLETWHRREGGYLPLKFITTSRLRQGYVSYNSTAWGFEHTHMHTHEEFGKNPRLVASPEHFLQWNPSLIETPGNSLQINVRGICSACPRKQDTMRRTRKAFGQCNQIKT